MSGFGVTVFIVRTEPSSFYNSHSS